MPTQPSGIAGLADGRTAFALAFAAGLEPPASLTVSEWADRNRQVPYGAYPGPWSTNLMPFMREVMDCLSPEHPSESVTLIKSTQVGGSEAALNWLGLVIDQGLGETMVVHPTHDAGFDWVREKLIPSIDATRPLRKKARAAERDGTGSTLRRLVFPGGFILITGANSTRGLRQHTIRNVVEDELDDWPEDLGEQGDPEAMVAARQTTYVRVGLAKTFRVSTPTIKGASRIERHFEAGDRRRYHVPCPECGELQVLEWKRLRFNPAPPFEARYGCAHCGVLIEHWQKDDMLRDAAAGGRACWIAELPGEGRQPSFAISELYSPLTTWDHMAAGWTATRDDPVRLKAFVNLRLGETWEERGEAPAHEVLRNRTIGSYRRGEVPAGGLLITGAADVQADGIWWEAVAHGADKTTWSLDFGFFPGNPSDPADAVWRKMDELVTRKFPTARGRMLGFDAFGIDAQYSTGAVKAWARRHPGVLPLRGEDGWHRPAIGAPRRIEYDRHGKGQRGTLQSWPVGTWSLKGELYSQLGKKGTAEGEGRNPPGYCHFAEGYDDEYFRQLTAEYLAQETRRGRVLRFWKARGANHLHDCRIYNMALADHLGINRSTPEEWARLAAVRDEPIDEVQATLFRQFEQPLKPAAPAEDPASPPLAMAESGTAGEGEDPLAAGGDAAAKAPTPAQPAAQPQPVRRANAVRPRTWRGVH
ncbi:MAG: phage terminase large subunit family protein [Vicinamibacterales bacterium]